MDQSNPVLDKNGFVFDILKRLPAKSLIRFTCVSKSWCHLISKDPSFIYLHLQFQKSSKDPGALLFLPDGQQHNRVKRATLEYLSLETSEHKKMKSPWKRPWIQNKKQICGSYQDFLIAGHCNGLVCVSDAHKLIIWNPGIRRFKILPDSNDFNHQLQRVDEYLLQRHKVHFQMLNETIIGFGSVGDEHNCYKVVRMIYTWGRDTCSRPTYPSIGEVYDSRTSSWTRIADDNVQRLSIKEFTNTSTFVDRSLYWLGERNKTKDEEEETGGHSFPWFYPKITAFNLVDEKFQTIKLPDGFDLETNSAKKITAFGRSQLALFAGDHRHNLLLTVWVMEEDQVSWSKLFRINLRAEPLGFSRNGEVFLKMRYAKLILFDPKLQDPCCFQDLGFNVHHAVDYVESLLLLDGERGEEDDPNHAKAEEARRLVEEAEEQEEYLKALSLFD